MICQGILFYMWVAFKRKNFITLLKTMALPENQDKNLVVVSNGGDEYQEAQSFIFEKKMGESNFF